MIVQNSAVQIGLVKLSLLLCYFATWRKQFALYPV